MILLNYAIIRLWQRAKSVIMIQKIIIIDSATALLYLKQSATVPVF